MYRQAWKTASSGAAQWLMSGGRVSVIGEISQLIHFYTIVAVYTLP